jgi:uncharacterized protein (DUF362 family)
MKKYGNVNVETAATAEKFAALIGTLNLTPPVLIKPNWGTVECYTEADILDWTLAAIPGEKMVIESHGWARNEETLLQKGPVGLTKANLRKGDRWFLEYSGINRVLEKHGVEYLNLTEEIWAGRAADPAAIQRAVEEKYLPVQSADQYARVPARLYEMRGGSLLSLTKYKIVFYPLGVSLSVKNLFGLIPGPSRGKYHGKEHALLDQNIVDINKIYHSLFSVKGIIEAVHSAGYLERDGEPTQVKPGCGVAFGSEDTVVLDAFATCLAGRDPESVGHLRLAGETFGAWASLTLAEAERSGIKVL